MDDFEIGFRRGYIAALEDSDNGIENGLEPKLYFALRFRQEEMQKDLESYRRRLLKEISEWVYPESPVPMVDIITAMKEKSDG